MNVVKCYAGKSTKRGKKTVSQSELVKATKSLILKRTSVLSRSMSVNGAQVFKELGVAKALSTIQNNYSSKQHCLCLKKIALHPMLIIGSRDRK